MPHIHWNSPIHTKTITVRVTRAPEILDGGAVRVTEGPNAVGHFAPHQWNYYVFHPAEPCPWGVPV